MENSLITIDGTGGKFTMARWRNFCGNIKEETEDIIIMVNDYEKIIPFNNLREYFETDKTVKIFEKAEGEFCSLANSSTLLIVDVTDMLWWLQRRKNGEFYRMPKMFDVEINVQKSTKSTKSKTSTRVAKTIKVAAGVMNGAEIEELDIYEGDRKSAIQFINNYFAKSQIRTNFESVVKFVVGYENDEELTISTNWKTIDELEAEGMVELR